MFCIAGADGFLGAYIQKALLSKGEKIIALNHTLPVFTCEGVTNLSFDVENKSCLDEAERLLRKHRDINFIYLISSHNPDFVRKFPERAEAVNITAFENFAEKISFCDIKSFYYASSDTVYGESKNGEYFTEKSPLNPINIYGEHKARAEEAAFGHGFSAARFSYMFAPSLSKKAHFFDSLIKKLNAGEEIRMFTDYVRCSLTYTAGARCLTELIYSNSHEKAVNICAAEATSKYDIGLLAADYCKAEKSLVVPVKSADESVFTEKRAERILMSADLLFSAAPCLKNTDFYLL